MFKNRMLMFVILLMISGVAPALDEPIPTQIAALAWAGVDYNADWEPYIQEFDGVDMVLVPVGCFMMGSTETQLDSLLAEEVSPSMFDDEIPADEVCFEEPFWIDRYEVTNALFQDFVDAGGYDNSQYWTDAALRWMDYNIDYTEPADYATATEPQQPRVGISSFSANAYARWRGCRIPTEAEWEYAARGPDSLIYPWGNEFVADNTPFWNFDSDRNKPVDVGSYPDGASWVGALDMSSNVWEWVNSLYKPYPYDADDGREKIVAPDDIGDGFDNRQRVMRGGSYGMDFHLVRSALRYAVRPGNISPDFGFRCANDVIFSGQAQ